MILDTLQRISTGTYEHEGEKVRNCMLFMPPGAAKSTYASSVFPAWYLGAYPNKQVILASYGSDLARKHGKKARKICGSAEFRSVFETGIAPDTRAADEWALESGSEYMSGGLLSGITGNRADGIIIDDPVKGAQDAESETIRESTRNAYLFDIDTRLKPSGWKCLIQTRWHELDLAGTILPEGWAGESGVVRCTDGDLWAIICLQAECERLDDPLGREIGQMLWPEWFTPEHWRRFKHVPRLWRALCQQVPTADDGIFFQREWFKWYINAPDHLNKYISIDVAETQDAGDYTFIIVWGVCPKGDIYILNMWRGQVTTDKWVDVLAAENGYIKAYEPLALVPEDDNIFKGVKPFLEKRMREERALCAIAQQPSGSRSKRNRAAAFQGIAAMGRVHLPTGHPLSEALLDQWLKFDAGRYDDGVDASSAFGRFISKVWEKVPPEEKKEPKVVADQVTHLVIEDLFKDKVEDEW